jgi:putative salt-induced outer membrane protein YdiY
MLEHERLALPDSALHPQQTIVVRSSSFLTLRVTSGEGFVVTSTTYLQPDVLALRDVRLLENLRLASSITESVAITVSFNLRYDSRPPDGVAMVDTVLRTGVRYTY